MATPYRELSERDKRSLFEIAQEARKKRADRRRPPSEKQLAERRARELRDDMLRKRAWRREMAAVRRARRLERARAKRTMNPAYDLDRLER